MVIKKTTSYMVMIFLIIMGLFCRYTEFFAIWKLAVLGGTILLLSSKSYATALFQCLVNRYTMIMFAIIIFSSLSSNNNAYFLENIKGIFWPFFLISIVAALNKVHGSVIESCLKNFWGFLNVIYILNLILITIQCSGKPILIKANWIAYNSFYEDLCCGLFGLNGTHEFTSFALFMNVFNYAIYKTSSKNKRIKLGMYIVFSDLWLLYISTKNDNVAMFILLPAFFILAIMSKNYFETGKIKRMIKKNIKYLIPIMVILLFLVNIPYIKAYVDKYVLIRVKMLLQFNKSYYQIAGSNERFAIVFTALSTYKGWTLGEGFGSAPVFGGNYFGFGSFGLSSIGSFIMVGGIWLYSFYTLACCRLFQCLLKRKYAFDSFTLMILGYTILYSSYTILYTSFVSAFWFAMIFFVLGILRGNYI